MRFGRVLFIQPSYSGSYFADTASDSPPLGIGYVAETLRRHGIASRLVDFGLGDGIEEVTRATEAFRPDAIAVSMMTFRYKHHYEMIQSVREACPDLPIIAGGPHVTSWRDKVLQQCTPVDFGICFEGEQPMLELCQGQSLSEIGGLIHRSRGRIVSNPQRAFSLDLDAIPYPTFEGLGLARYGGAVQICSSRGCPHRCIFCQSGSVLGARWRARSAANVAEEIQYWYERGRRLFSFIDDNFTLNRSRVETLCREIEQRGMTDARFVAAGVRADRVDHPLLAQMRRAGFSHLAFGVESGNDRILNILRKGETLEQIDAAVEAAIGLEFLVTLYFIVGSPHETLANVKESIRFAMKYPIENAYFSNLMPIPGTELYRWIRENGRLLQEPEQYLNDFAEFEREPLFDAPGMSLSERRTALELTEQARQQIQQRAQRRRERAHSRARFARFGLAGRVFGNLYSSAPGLAARRVARLVLQEN